MVRVYRKDLGFGEGTDGQNYYEVSEERAKELAAVGYTTNPQEANVGRADPGGSIYTGVDTPDMYIAEEVSPPQDTTAQTPEQAPDTEVVDIDLMAIPKGAEFWNYEGNIAIVYRIPGDPNATPLRYTSSQEDLVAIFGPIEAENITFTEPSKDDWNRSLVFGNSVELYDPSIIDPTRNPWESFVGAVEKQAAVRPWLKSEEMLYLLAESTLEGRTVTDAEWESTEWWRTHTQAEREWLLLAQQVNPDTGEVMTKDALEKVYDDRIKIKNAMVSAGIFNLNDDLVNWVAEKFTTGQWSGTYTDEQIKLLADPQLPGDIDTGMQTFIDQGGVTFDTTRAGEQQVKDLVAQWWGPVFGANVKDSQIEQWAGMLRNDPNGEIKLIDKLKASRKSLFPEYDEDLTYEEIASPWRGFVQNAWGQNVDDASNVVQEVIKLNDTVKAGQYLFKKGLEDNVAKPTQEALKAMSQAFGSGQRGRI